MSKFEIRLKIADKIEMRAPSSFQIISDIQFRSSHQTQAGGDQRAETNGVLIKCFISAVALSNVLLMVTHSYNTISIITHTDNFNHRRDMKIRTGGACKK